MEKKDIEQVSMRVAGRPLYVGADLVNADCVEVMRYSYLSRFGLTTTEQVPSCTTRLTRLACFPERPSLVEVARWSTPTKLTHCENASK